MKEEDEEMLLHHLLPDVVEQVLVPIHENHPALREHRQEPKLQHLVGEVAAKLKPAAAGRGIKVSGTEHRDAVETEIKHQIADLLLGNESKKRKLSEFTRFLKEDISSALRDAFETALELHARNKAAVERIATEASLSINQLLGQAKKEFDLRNPQAPTHHLDPDVCEALSKRIEKLDAHYSLPTIVDLLKEKLGIVFIDALRERLQHHILEATREFQANRGPIEPQVIALQQTAEKEIKRARGDATEAFPREDVREQVLADLEALSDLYTDQENLAARFAPYA